MRTPTIRWNPRAATHRAAYLGLMALLLALPALAHAHGHRSIDLSRLVVVGDSISAGYQNSSLLGSQQIHGYASLVAQQAGVELPLPLISEPGFPAALTLVDPGPPPVIEPKSELYGTRIDPSVQPFNLSVPGARVQDALYRHDSSPFHGPYEPIYMGLSNLVLGPARNADGTPMSQVDWAEAL